MNPRQALGKATGHASEFSDGMRSFPEEAGARAKGLRMFLRLGCFIWFLLKKKSGADFFRVSLVVSLLFHRYLLVMSFIEKVSLLRGNHCSFESIRSKVPTGKGWLGQNLGPPFVFTFMREKR